MSGNWHRIVREAHDPGAPGWAQRHLGNPGMNVFRYTPVMLVAVLLPAAAPLRADDAVRYEAVFSDGRRVEGGRITGWGVHPGSPRLDSTPLQDVKRPLRWLRNRGLEPWRMPAEGRGYIEFVGGDRIIGRVTGSRPSSEVDGVHTPAHLLVVPAVSPQGGQPTPMRVLIDGIRRIVITRTPRRGRPPGTLLYHDGRRVGFVGIRLGENSLCLLLTDGTLDVKLVDVAEVHFPRIDPWEAYFRELGILSPACRSRLMRFETPGGLIATGSELRFRAEPYPTPEHQRQALDHIKRLDEHIQRLETGIKQQREKLDQARAEHAKQSAELENRRKAARQAHEKAKADVRRHIDQQKKNDADQWTQKRQKIDRDFKSADEATVKRLQGEKPEKRGGMLNAFRLQQAQQRKTREQALEAERSRLDKQRAKELADADAREVQKLKGVEADCQNRAVQLKARLDQATAHWERYLASIAQAKSQRAAAPREQGNSATWHHVIQPAWSLDALRVPFERIYMRWSFAPGRVPLSRVRPTASVSPPLLPWRAGLKSNGQPLSSGGRQYAWGFGVHAYSELSFTLPPFANSFQASVGLDHSVGPGGCARARVFLASTTARPLYESPLLIGSKKTADTGAISIAAPAKGPKRLILQADAAHRGRPPGTDPLNIRDRLDWLDPVIGLDAAGLQEVVHREAARQLHPWKGWTVKFDKRGAYTWTSHFWQDKSAARGLFLTMIRAERQPLVLSREITVAPGDNWLTVDTGGFAADDTFHPKAIPLRIGKTEIKPEPTPIRQDWQTRDAPPAFGLGPYRGKKVTLELTQPAGGASLYWHRMGISDELPGAYRVARVLKQVGKADMKVSLMLGWALQSDAVSDPQRLLLLEIHASGGVVNFWNPTVGNFRRNELNNVLVGRGWKGGDKAFMTLAKMGSLKSLLLAADAGISAAAVEKLKAQRPDLTVRPFERTPSSLGRPCRHGARNLCDKDVMVQWVSYEGQLAHPRTIKPNATIHLGTRAGVRYEAYIGGKLIATYNVVSVPGRPSVVWDIKR